MRTTLRLVVFVFTLISVWRYLRLNPSFNRKSLIETIVVSLMLAVLLGGSAIAIGQVEGRTPRLVLVTVFAVIAVFGCIGILLKAAMPRVALPSGVIVTDLHRAPIRVWITRTYFVTGALAIAGACAPGNAKIYLWISAGLLALVAGFSLFISYWQASWLDRALTALQTNAWVHWSCSERRWANWKAAEEARLRQFYSLKANWRLAVRIGSVAFLALVGAVGIGVQGNIQAGVPMIAAGLAFLVIAFALVGWSTPRKLRARIARIDASAPEVWVGPDGISCAGEFSPFVATGVSLASITIPDGPVPQFVIRFQRPGSQYSWIRTVPIPDVAYAEIGRLQSQFREKFPGAEITLVPALSRQ
jgi:hypothetical protein